MEQTNEEIVGELYALRGGLSVISLKSDSISRNDDKCNALQSRINTANNRITQLNSDIYEHKRGLSNKEQKLSNACKIYETAIDDYDREVKSITKEETKDKLGSIMPIIGGCSILPIIGIIQIFIFVSVAVGFAVLGAIALIFLIIVAVIYNKNKKKAQQQVSSKVRSLASAMQQAQYAVNAEKSTIEGLKKEKAEAIDNAAEIEESCEAQIEEINEMSHDIAQIALDYNNALEAVYGKKLNPVDWQHIDLIIYYLQTGRADTIKESLQMVDRQKQTNEIVSTIKQASIRVCGEIRNGFTMLGKTMVTCFNALSSEISALSTQLSNQHSEQMNALRRLSEQNGEILTATQLTSALQAKANLTSERLIKDVKFIKSRV